MMSSNKQGSNVLHVAPRKSVPAAVKQATVLDQQLIDALKFERGVGSAQDDIDDDDDESVGLEAQCAFLTPFYAIEFFHRRHYVNAIARSIPNKVGLVRLNLGFPVVSKTDRSRAVMYSLYFGTSNSTLYALPRLHDINVYDKNKDRLNQSHEGVLTVFCERVWRRLDFSKTHPAIETMEGVYLEIPIGEYQSFEFGGYTSSKVQIIRNSAIVHFLKFDLLSNLNDASNIKTCQGCSRVFTETLSRCSACKWVFYCSKQCQIQAWHQQHSAFCPVIQRASKKPCVVVSKDRKRCYEDLAILDVVQSTESELDVVFEESLSVLDDVD